ncbi:MAG: hydrogenase iron-sulfur subunit [bacterium]|nr:hydrogenase iron-sulfur subunit [bacterium]
MSDETFEPKIVAFLCNWCSYRASDLAGTARMPIAANVRALRVMCSGRVDPAFVLEALARGADGVIIAGCHPGECHYIEQNYKTLRRFLMLRHTMRHVGIDERRLRLVWASAAEGKPLADAFNDMTETVRGLGPLRWSSNWDEDERQARAVDSLPAEHAEAMEVLR